METNDKNIQVIVEKIVILFTISSFFIIFLAISFYVIVTEKSINNNVMFILRVILSLISGCFTGYFIPGIIKIKISNGKKKTIQASGAIAITVLIFYLNPPNIVENETQKIVTYYEQYQNQKLSKNVVDAINNDTTKPVKSSQNIYTNMNTNETTTEPVSESTTMELSTTKPSTTEPSTTKPSTTEPSTTEPVSKIDIRVIGHWKHNPVRTGDAFETREYTFFENGEYKYVYNPNVYNNPIYGYTKTIEYGTYLTQNGTIHLNPESNPTYLGDTFTNKLYILSDEDEWVLSINESDPKNILCFHKD